MNSNKQIIFMHIAKAAGSSINNIFAQVLGADKCRFHIEWPLHTQSIEQILEDKIFVSGHIYFNSIQQVDPTNTIKFTVLREPFSHIVSHILWLDHYGQTEYEQEYKALNKDIKILVDCITRTNLANSYDLDHLLTNLPPWGIKLLNNCQTRYLIGQQNSFEPLSLKVVPLALKNLKHFDVYGSIDNLEVIIKRVFQLYGDENLNLDACDFNKKTNQQVSGRVINIQDPLVRSILQKHILVDIRIYNSMLSEISQRADLTPFQSI
jgi:hypothetical protein